MAEKFSPQYELGAGAFGRAIVVENKESKKKFVAKIIQVHNIGKLFNSLPHNPDFCNLEKKPVENNVGKGENAGNQ